VVIVANDAIVARNALGNEAPLADMPEALQQVRRGLLRNSSMALQTPSIPCWKRTISWNS
jgi:hypothetical protein